MSDDKKPEMKRVWVLGGGITGLTAAHELAERGFKVTVVEHVEDPLHPGQPMLGGLAATQWAVPDDAAANAGEKWARADRLVPPLRLAFEPGVVEVPEAMLTLINRYVHGFRGVIDTYRGRNLPNFRVVSYEVDGDTPAVRGARVVAVRDLMRAALLEKRPDDPSVCVVVSRDDQVLPHNHDTPPKEAIVDIRISDVHMPSEHGFRYFPAFYRHVFDTMRRIRILDDREKPSPRPYHTVIENLVPTTTVVIAAKRGLDEHMNEKPVAIVVPRDTPSSLHAVQEVTRKYLDGLGYDPSDMAHFVQKVAKYLTSGPKRRATYESMSWWDFIEGDKLSPRCQQHTNAMPKLLVASDAHDSDARTQGTCLVQLLLNQALGSPYSDATLNNTTSSAWFSPWRDYLKHHGVEFIRGTVTGFRREGERIRPTFAPPLNPKFEDDDCFIVALPILVMVKTGFADELLQRFRDLAPKKPGELRDLQALDRWVTKMKTPTFEWPGPPKKLGPIRHLAGIQYYFDADVHPTKGHTVYIDSPWALSSLSQLSFWTGARREVDGYRGIVSVDVCDFFAEGNNGKKLWESTRTEIAKEVWSQIAASLPKEDNANADAEPRYFHITNLIRFDKDEKPVEDMCGYLVARPGEWADRPGDLGKPGYAVAGGKWVLAGTYMKTWTRLTTMEAANESGRRAVNALLDAHGSGRPRCEVWNPEDQEPGDLQPLKDLDDKLVEAGLPHALDIVGSDLMTEALLAPLFG